MPFFPGLFWGSSGNPKERYCRVAEESSIRWFREMKNPQRIYSTQDADSEGEEGKFYVWKRDQIKSYWEKEKDAFLCRLRVTSQGNFERGWTSSILPLLEKSPNIWISFRIERVLEEDGEAFCEREKRIRPGRDEKVLTSEWLMISSFADDLKSVETRLS